MLCMYVMYVCNVCMYECNVCMENRLQMWGYPFSRRITREHTLISAAIENFNPKEDGDIKSDRKVASGKHTKNY